VAPNLVDDRGRIVLLFGCREILALVKDEPLLGRSFLLFWLWDGRDELGASPAFDDPLRRLAGLVEFPVTGRVFVRRIENRAIKKRIGHYPQSPIVLLFLALWEQFCQAISLRAGLPPNP
jgi:hypothetical protein